MKQNNKYTDTEKLEYYEKKINQLDAEYKMNREILEIRIKHLEYKLGKNKKKAEE